MRIGDIFMYGGATPPKNFLLCNGTAVSRTAYAELFAVIGTTYGVGDGSTTFNIPDFRKRIPVGYKSSDSDFDTIGKIGGAKTANLAHTHTHSHTHSISGSTNGPGSTVAGDTGAFFGIATNTHTHTFSATSGQPTDSNTSSALSSAQSVLNPYVTVNFIIRYKVHYGGQFIFSMMQ